MSSLLFLKEIRKCTFKNKSCGKLSQRVCWFVCTYEPSVHSMLEENFFYARIVNKAYVRMGACIRERIGGRAFLLAASYLKDGNNNIVIVVII